MCYAWIEAVAVVKLITDYWMNSCVFNYNLTYHHHNYYLYHTVTIIIIMTTITHMCSTAIYRCEMAIVVRVASSVKCTWYNNNWIICHTIWPFNRCAHRHVHIYIMYIFYEANDIYCRTRNSYSNQRLGCSVVYVWVGSDFRIIITDKYVSICLSPCSEFEKFTYTDERKKNVESQLSACNICIRAGKKTPNISISHILL